MNKVKIKFKHCLGKIIRTLTFLALILWINIVCILVYGGSGVYQYLDNALGL